MSEAGPAEVLESMCAAFERLEVDAFIALLDENAQAYFPYLPDPYPKEARGREEIAAIFTLVDQLFAEFAFTKREPIPASDPELLIVRASSKGTLKNGDGYTNDYVFFIRVRDGKIIEYREYFDTTRLLAAVATISA